VCARGASLAAVHGPSTSPLGVRLACLPHALRSMAVSHMTKNALVVGALVLAALAVTPFVRGADTPDRPPGVTPEAWIPLNNEIGIVISPPDPASFAPAVDEQGRPRAMVLGRPVQGCFMMKVASSFWARVAIVEPAIALPVSPSR